MNKIHIDDISFENFDTNYLSNLYNGQSLEIGFLYKSKFENTKHLREYISIILEFLNLDLIRKNRFILIIDELNNNAIEYGSSPDSLNQMRFIYKKNNNNDNFEINIEVEDMGNSQKHKTSIEMEKIRDEKEIIGFLNHKSIRGRGLFMIISKLVDKLYFKDSDNNGLIVGIVKTFKNI